MPGKSDGANGGGIAGGLAFMGILVLVALLSSTSRSPSSQRSFSIDTPTPPGPGGVTIDFEGSDPEGAIIRVVGTDDQGYLYQGAWNLRLCSSGQQISVWAPGYNIMSFPCIDGPNVRYQVALEQVNTGDDHGYQWIGAGRHFSLPQNCANCHTDRYPGLNEYPEWQKDGHSRAFSDDYFWTTYKGTNVYDQPSQQIQWQILEDGQKIYPLIDPMKPDYGAGYRLDYPVSNGNCAFCHVPAGAPGTLQETNLSDLIGELRRGQTSPKAEGVTCDVCHKVTDVQVGKNKLPYDDRPGVLSMSILRPSGQQLVTGPLAVQSIPDNAFKRTCYPVFSESKFCASCHFGKYANTQIYGAYQEWLQSPYAERYNRSADGQITGERVEYRSCQDCHMLYDQNITNTLPSERDACSAANVNFRNFNHNMMNYGPDPENSLREIPRLVQGAATIALEPRLEGGQIKLKVAVTNTGAGHKFPTDSPLRHLILLIEARDWRENKLTQTSGPTVPVWAAMDQAGYTGEVYANLLKDKDTNLAPSFAYWNPVENAWQGSDTRLVPGVGAVSEYAFAAPYDRWATITARLIYRRAFYNAVTQKGWNMEELDVKVTQTVLRCTGFGEDPEHMVCEVEQPQP